MGIWVMNDLWMVVLKERGIVFGVVYMRWDVFGLFFCLYDVDDF